MAKSLTYVSRIYDVQAVFRYAMVKEKMLPDPSRLEALECDISKAESIKYKTFDDEYNLRNKA